MALSELSCGEQGPCQLVKTGRNSLGVSTGQEGALARLEKWILSRKFRNNFESKTEPTTPFVFANELSSAPLGSCCHILGLPSQAPRYHQKVRRPLPEAAAQVCACKNFGGGGRAPAAEALSISVSVSMATT